MVVVTVHYRLQIELCPFCQRNRASDEALRCPQMWMAAPYRALSPILKVVNVPGGTSRAGLACRCAACPTRALGAVPPARVLRLIAQKLCQPDFFRRG